MPNMDEMQEFDDRRARKRAEFDAKFKAEVDDFLNEPPQGRPLTEDEQRRENERIFLREHIGHSGPSEWGPAGKPGPAGRGPIQSQDSTGTDATGLKA